jgi:DNA-binding transcriptional LysR family regulator
MNLNDVLVFVHVARLQSFTLAARKLELPKSTVSERITRLEKRLGVRLLERTTRSLRLTETGSQYLSRVEGLVHDLETAERDVSEAHQATRGVLRVGSPLLFAQAFLSDLVAEYLDRYPDIEIELVLADRSFDVVAENLDLVIHVTGPIDPSMVVRKLGIGRRVCVASPEYLAARGTPTKPAALREHACLVSGATRKTKWEFGSTSGPRARAHRETIAISGRYAVTSIELVYRAALRGLGVAILPEFLCTDALADGRLVRLLDGYTADETVVQIVYASQRHLSARARTFADHLIERSAIVLANLPR